ncbi:hypothetical protein Nepgr_005697 [Nepenthes gracilis]|uniref:Exocyst subunit Exo70 family protein n=1 Tax=Nepenthes gracilis TaxID=150966 RepID=A0AAD3S3S6_NEPGR|nr:hypothetical protein Nepgr_005697 [Nepenthes gracilis]
MHSCENLVLKAKFGLNHCYFAFCLLKFVESLVKKPEEKHSLLIFNFLIYFALSLELKLFGYGVFLSLMEEAKGIKSVLAATQILRASLEKSKVLASEIDEVSPRLENVSKRLPFLAAEIRSSHARTCMFAVVRGHVEHAICPATAALKVHDAVRCLERLSTSDPCCDTFGCLPVVKQMEEALRFLNDNCVLAVQWMEDVVKLLEDSVDADDEYVVNVKRCLRALKELMKIEAYAHLEGGLLSTAFDKLELEFRRLLKEEIACHRVTPLSTTLIEGQEHSVLSLVSEGVIQKFHAVLERLKVNGRLENCTSIYVEVRILSVRAVLQALNLSYLRIEVSEHDPVKSIEDYITQWGKHLEFVLKNVFQVEYELSKKVFDKIASDVSIGCFTQIATQSGFLMLLQFGYKVTETKKDAIKLLKLLDVFQVLNSIRLDFNRLFGGKDCVEIQTVTRNLIKRVVEGACEIFTELSAQLELQWHTRPPSDGSVPQLVTFVTHYCITLLGDNYHPILSHVMLINQTWNSKRSSDKGDLRQEFYKINVKGSEFANLMGEDWLRRYEQKTEYYTAAYLNESWGKLPAILSKDNLILFSPGRTTARQLMMRRLKEFDERFDFIYKIQSEWVVNDRYVREKTCQLIVNTVVPHYRSYLHNYGFLVEQGSSPSKLVKYSPLGMEGVINCLFQPKIDKFTSSKPSHFIGRIRSVIGNQFRTSAIAT